VEVVEEEELTDQQLLEAVEREFGEDLDTSEDQLTDEQLVRAVCALETEHFQ